MSNLKIGAAAKTRTNGRGVTRVITGTILALVERDTTAPKKYHGTLPHGKKSSNRDRYILQTKTGLCWANVKTTIGASEKLPKHNPRLSKPAKKVKAKKIVKVKKPASKVKTVKVSKPAAAVAPKKAEKPKQTWYGLVDGKVVSVRKVLCPEGFSAVKIAVPTPAPAASPEALPQAAV